MCVQNLYNDLQLFLYSHSTAIVRLRSCQVRNIFDTFFLPQVPFIHREENLAMDQWNRLAKEGVVECGH